MLWLKKLCRENFRPLLFWSSSFLKNQFPNLRFWFNRKEVKKLKSFWRLPCMYGYAHFACTENCGPRYGQFFLKSSQIWKWGFNRDNGQRGVSCISSLSQLCYEKIFCPRKSIVFDHLRITLILVSIQTTDCGRFSAYATTLKSCNAKSYCPQKSQKLFETFWFSRDPPSHFWVWGPIRRKTLTLENGELMILDNYPVKSDIIGLFKSRWL